MGGEATAFQGRAVVPAVNGSWYAGGGRRGALAFLMPWRVSEAWWSAETLLGSPLARIEGWIEGKFREGAWHGKQKVLVGVCVAVSLHELRDTRTTRRR